jgi:hypothetical protein
MNKCTECIENWINLGGKNSKGPGSMNRESKSCKEIGLFNNNKIKGHAMDLYSKYLKYGGPNNISDNEAIDLMSGKIPEDKIDKFLKCTKCMYNYGKTLKACGAPKRQVINVERQEWLSSDFGRKANLRSFINEIGKGIIKGLKTKDLLEKINVPPGLNSFLKLKKDIKDYKSLGNAVNDYNKLMKKKVSNVDDEVPDAEDKGDLKSLRKSYKSKKSSKYNLLSKIYIDSKKNGSSDNKSRKARSDDLFRNKTNKKKKLKTFDLISKKNKRSKLDEVMSKEVDDKSVIIERRG